jgi:feruloyl esterase
MRWFAATALALGMTGAAHADAYALNGTITQDDQISFFTLTVPTASTVSVTSIGYAGGTAAGGGAVAAGGFDSMLFLYNSLGTLVAQSDDGIGVPTDPATGLASDAAFSLVLAAGSYTLALTQYDNFALGNLAAGFSEAGQGNFTPTLSGGCNATKFCDWSGAARTGNWALNVDISPVPEAPTAALMLGGLLAFGAIRRRARRSLIAAPALLALSAPAAMAADYSITSLNTTPSPALVPSTGDGTVMLNIKGPSTAAILRSAVKLNGRNVTSAFVPDGQPGSMTGLVPGLQPGDNVIQIFDSKTSTTPQAQLRVSKALQPLNPCSTMVGRSIDASLIGAPTSGATITTAVLTAATVANTSITSRAPEYCNITGRILPFDPGSIVINFRVSIPTEWNQKSWQIGGGGTDGSIPGMMTAPGSRPFSAMSPNNIASPIALGYALYGGDSGHTSGNTWIDNPNFPTLSESFQNFTFDALKKTHDAAVAIMNLMYGKKPAINYFGGQSQGGREALAAMTRYPADYDGILSQDFLAYFANLNYNPQLQGTFQLDPGTWVPSTKATALKNEVLRQCDAIDGLQDGIIQNYAGCADLFNPVTHPNAFAAIRCTGAETTSCVTDAQIATLLGQSFMGQVNYNYPLKNGETSYPGWGPLEGLSLLSSSQPALATGTSYTGAGAGGSLGIALVREYFCMSQTCNVLQVLSNLDAQQQKIQVLSEAVDISDDWTPFKARGGKVMTDTSGADTISNPLAQFRLYDRVTSKLGQAAVDSFARFFVSPMTGHGGGGNGATVPTTADLQTPMINWVENNVTPPEDPPVQMRLTTSGSGAATVFTIAQSRPLCRYPKYPQYNGSGDANLASNYTCTTPVLGAATASTAKSR